MTSVTFFLTNSSNYYYNIPQPEVVPAFLDNHVYVDASHQVSVHLARQFQRRRFFRYRPIRNKNCLWWTCLLTDRDDMSNLHREHSTDSSYQVSVNLAKRFQRRFKLEAQHWAKPVSLTFQSALRKLNTEPSIAYRCFPSNFGSFWQSSFREEDF